MEKEGFVYIWFDRKHKRYYIGCHWGTLDDGYICSSLWMKQGYKHRPYDFKRRILKKGIDKNDLHAEEYAWLRLIKEDELGKKYYNLHNHHFDHWSAIESSNISVRQKLSEASKKLHQDPEYKQRFLEGRKKLPPQTPEQIEKRVKANTGKKRSDETKRKISDAHRGEKNHMYGKTLPKEMKQKISQKLAGSNNPFYGKQHDPELKKRMNEKTSQTMKGRMPKNIPTGFWWNNGSINKRSHDYPGEGWVKGKLRKSIV